LLLPESECPAVTVEGDWSPAQSKTVRNKLQLYFQSKKKSSGGDCRVEVEEEAARAAVFFRAEEGECPRLRRSWFCSEPGLKVFFLSGSGSDPVVAVVLENVSENLNKDYLQMLVETVSGLDENDFSLEMIWESNLAVVNFSAPTGRNRNQNQNQNQNRLTEPDWFPLNTLFFRHPFTASLCSWCLAAVVQSICVKEDHEMRSIPVKLYAFYGSLGTALYGQARPAWKMPEPVTEKVLKVIWKFLLFKKMLKSINDQMRPHFCGVDLDQPEVKLSPLPSFLRQKSLTAKDVDSWAEAAKDAFCKLMAQYSAFECDANTEAWRAAEKEVRSVVKEDALVEFDPSRDVVTVAGRADDIKKIRAAVENILLKLMSHFERQTKGVTERLDFSPAYFHILTEEGLQKAASDVSPELKLSFNEATGRLTIAGLPAEVYQIKSWILEKNLNMKKKDLNVPAGLLEYLRQVNPMDMSKSLFTSQGISAIYCAETRGVFLLGSSDRALADAESKMKKDLLVQSLDVKDQEVLNRQNWKELRGELLDTYNSASNKTVIILIHPERRDKVTVAGFCNPVKEVSASLREFIQNYSQVQEVLRVESCAVAQFIQKNRREDWSRVASDNKVSVTFDPERPKIVISGARLHAHKARSILQQLTSALFADTLTVDKPGAKKYFLTQGSMFLPPVMSEFSCVVMLQPEIQDDEEEEEGSVEDECYCKVHTAGGVLVSVSRADICSFKVDAVVNAANEDLQHIGGLALALLRAAGPNLQKISNDHVAKHGKVRPGEAIVTDGCNLPCKYVVHAVGPRYSDFDRKTSISRLKRAVGESLRQAEQVSCSTVAMPAISSGVFGFPVDLCTETIAEAVREYCDNPGAPGCLTEIHLVDNNDATVRVMAAAVSREFSDLEPIMTVPPPAGGKQRGSCSDLGPQTDGIVNTVADNMNLSQGAVSKAILEAAGENLQLAVLTQAGVSALQFGDVVVTDAYNLMCQKVFHAVCPSWDNGGGEAEKGLADIITSCLKEAEKLRLTSLSFPAIGTGNLSFPRQLVARVLLRQIHLFSHRVSPRHLKEVVIVVHHSDRQTTDVRRPFCGSDRNSSADRTQLTSFSPVLSPSLGVYRMQMGQLTLEVSSGDITKETCDVIINSSNQNFNLQAGVSKAILDNAGPTVLLECAQIVKSPGYMPCSMIMTSGGQLPSSNIIHIIGQNDAAKIKEMVQGVLKLCEENKFRSVAFPALGTGLFSPSAVADAMVGAVVEFVRKKHPKFVCSVKILIFQTAMIAEFHNSMKKRQGEEVVEKSAFNKFMGIILTAKKRISELILNEQAQRTIRDQYINQFTQADMDELKALQRNLTVSIRLDRGQEDQEPRIHLEGLTRDVLTAESDIRSANRRCIERIQNTTLWQSYQLLKKQMEVKNNHTNNEKLLYHGTGAKSIDLINSKGFNRSYAGMHGAMYGNGSYFAVDPAYSAGGYAKPDNKGHKRMYQARVLVGDYTQGRSGIIAPPDKSGNAADQFDSVTDRPNNPSMFIVFHDIQAYPEYLITFT
uniref:Poly [ADP-ribose] polymerase n=1 Tax=Poecilia reticulata TaxID=8081 RepID=A0A3P9PUJ0_POERE